MIYESKPEGKFYFHFLAVPAEAFLNPEITHTETFLFSLIKNMSISNRGCWASNKYFSDILRVTKRTITHSLSDLEEKGYIRIEFADGERKISINEGYKQRYHNIVSLFNRGYIDNDKDSRGEFINLATKG